MNPFTFVAFVVQFPHLSFSAFPLFPKPQPQKETHMPSITILLADLHPITRAGFKAVLSARPTTARGRNSARAEAPPTFLETDNGRAALDLALKHKPDLAILDVPLRQLEGTTVAYRILEQELGTRVLICTALENDITLTRVIDSGAHGYLSKNTALAQLPEAVKAILGGTHWYDAVALRHLADHEGINRRNQHTQSPFNKREQEVLGLLLEKKNLSSKEIATIMNISEQTVEVYRKNLMKKTNSTKGSDIIHYGYANGMAFHA